MKYAQLWALLTLVTSSPIAFGYDRFSERHAPTRFVLGADEQVQLALKGRLHLQWRDLQGIGGPRHDSQTDTATLGTRSGHFALDDARLAVRVELPDGLAVYTAYAFTDMGAAVESGWVDYRWRSGRWRLHSELGLNQPFVAIDPETGRAPLVDRVYWGTSEAHATVELTYTATEITGSVGLSVAMMRPMGAEAVNDAAHRRGTIALLSYDQARPFSGNGPVFGLKAGVEWGPLSVLGFGYLGKMSADGGIDELRNRLAGFDLLAGYDPADPHGQSDAFAWGGMRLSCDPGSFRLRTTAVWSQESLLHRRILSAQVGYVWTMKAGSRLRSLEPRVRVEQYRLAAGQLVRGQRAFRGPDPSQALTWDYDLLTVSMSGRLYGALLWLRIEYTAIAEANGANSLQRPNQPIENNETTIGLELRF